MVEFFSPYKKVPCADGPRYILKHPENAFSKVAPDWDIRIKAAISASDKIKGDLDAGIARKYGTILQSLSKHYFDIQTHYRAAYEQFAANPCDPKASERLDNANSDIRSMELKLAEIEIKIEELLKAAEEAKKESEKATMHARGIISTPIKVKLPTTALEDLDKLISKFSL